MTNGVHRAVRAFSRTVWFFSGTGALLIACAGHPALFPAPLSAEAATLSRTDPVPTPTPSPTTPPMPHIEHIVIVIQENRSFDYLFQGFPGADTASSGLNSHGQRIKLTPISLTAHYDILHGSGAFFRAWHHGKLDGFNLEHRRGNSEGYPNPEYGYAPPSEIQPYLSMAQQYVLADRMFSSQIDGSFTAHQYLIAGFAGDTVNFPAGNWGCGPPPGMIRVLFTDHGEGPRVPACFNYTTLADELDQKGLPWHVYSPNLGVKGQLWNPFDAIRHIKFGPDWHHDVTKPEFQFLTDVAAGKLAAVTWIIPNLKYSDHSGSGTTWGPPWVASVVNAVGESRFWNSSVVFVLWDDWGGWYDHVPPPQLDFDGLGFRVPLLCISPYAKKGVVSHVLYEHASILRFAEENFGLAHMARADSRANSAGNGCLIRTPAPRRFVPITGSLDPSFFMRDNGPELAPDDE